MNPDKKYIIDELFERVNTSPFVLVVDYTGMTVPEFDTLRTTLLENAAECHVAKNTYMRKALENAGLPDISSELLGQTAFITGESDVCAASKAVKEFAKKAKKLTFKVGILDGDVLDVAQINALAELPPREVLLATLLSVINAPATQLVRVINEPATSVARVIKAKHEG